MAWIQDRLFKHFLVYLVSGGLSKAVPFLVLLAITNYLTREDFGLISNFNALVQLLTAVMSIKLMVTFQGEFFTLNDPERRKAVYNILCIEVLASFFLFISTFIFRNLFVQYFKLDYSWVIGAILLALCANVFDARSTILRLQENPKRFASYQVANSVLNGVFAILFVVVLNLGWEGRIYGAYVAAFLMFVGTVFFLWRGDWLQGGFSAKMIRRQLSVNLPLLPQAITPFLRKGIDKIVLTGAAGLAMNGIFSFALNLGAIFHMFIDSFLAAILPNFYKSLASLSAAEVKVSQLKIRLVKQTYLAALLLALMLIFGYFFLYWLVLIAFNERYHDAVHFLPFVLLEVFFQTLGRFFANYLIFVKKTLVFGSLVFGVGLLHAFLSFTLIPSLGIIGGLYALVVAEFVKFSASFFLANKYFPMPWFSFVSVKEN